MEGERELTLSLTNVIKKAKKNVLSLMDSKTNKIVIERGIRQGDQISPKKFTVMIDLK